MIRGLFQRRAPILPREAGGEPWLAAVIAVLCSGSALTSKPTQSTSGRIPANSFGLMPALCRPTL